MPKMSVFTSFSINLAFAHGNSCDRGIMITAFLDFV